MYFVVYDRNKNISGYTWRITAHRTSFYLSWVICFSALGLGPAGR